MKRFLFVAAFALLAIPTVAFAQYGQQSYGGYPPPPPPPPPPPAPQWDQQSYVQQQQPSPYGQFQPPQPEYGEDNPPPAPAQNCAPGQVFVVAPNNVTTHRIVTMCQNNNGGWDIRR